MILAVLATAIFAAIVRILGVRFLVREGGMLFKSVAQQKVIRSEIACPLSVRFCLNVSLNGVLASSAGFNPHRAGGVIACPMWIEPETSEARQEFMQSNNGYLRGFISDFFQTSQSASA